MPGLPVIVPVTEFRDVIGTALTGWRMDTVSNKQHLTPGDHTHSVRSSPGGYRSFHFWHSGFSGGK